MSKVIKIIFILTIIIFSINLIIVPKTYALADMMEAAHKFPTYGDDSAVNQGNLKSVSEKIFYPFLAVAVVIAVMVGAVIGIKIMTGTIEEKAKIKEMLVPYVVGLVVVFGAFTIWSTVVNIGTSVVGTGTYNPATHPTIRPISLKLDTTNVKTDYLAAESFDPTGLVVKVLYSDDTVAEITDYTWSPREPLGTNIHQIEIKAQAYYPGYDNNVLLTEHINITVRVP